MHWNGKLKYVINAWFYGGCFMLAAVLFLVTGLLSDANQLISNTFLAISLTLLGISFTAGIAFSRMMAQDGIGGPISRNLIRIPSFALLVVYGLISFVVILSLFVDINIEWYKNIGEYVANASNGAESAPLLHAGMFGFALCVATLTNTIITRISMLFPSLTANVDGKLPFEEFMINYGAMILYPLFMLGFGFMNYFGYLAPANLIPFNYFALFAFILIKRLEDWSRFDTFLRIARYVLTGIFFVLNLVILICLLGGAIEDFNFKNIDHIFVLDVTGWYVLTMVICIPLYCVIEVGQDILHKEYQAIIFLALPVVTYGLQWLMIYFPLVTSIVTVVLVLLIILIGKITRNVWEDRAKNYYDY